jgi:hypothetical protein
LLKVRPLVLSSLLELRLTIIDSVNQLPAAEQSATARAWSQILDHEAVRLSAGAASWLPAAANQPTLLRRRHARQWGRLLGQAETRLSLIVADQVVAALLRGYVGI